jgi:Arc/MetJ-type ribon-helix-helix transcriptional regulator
MKVSVSITEDDVVYLESQIASGRFATRSAAMHAAIKLMRTRDLEAQYAAAAHDWRESGDGAAWDAANADGLDDSAW